MAFDEILVLPGLSPSIILLFRLTRSMFYKLVSRIKSSTAGLSIVESKQDLWHLWCIIWSYLLTKHWVFYCWKAHHGVFSFLYFQFCWKKEQKQRIKTSITQYTMLVHPSFTCKRFFYWKRRMRDRISNEVDTTRNDTSCPTRSTVDPSKSFLQ